MAHLKKNFSLKLGVARLIYLFDTLVFSQNLLRNNDQNP